MVGAREINGRDPGNQWLGPMNPKVGAEETNGWGPGNQWWGSRKSMVGAGELMIGVQEIDC